MTLKQTNSFPKLPPQDIDIETSILSSCFDDDASEVVEHIKTPEIFYRSANQKIYKAIQELVSKNLNPDLVTTVSLLNEKKQLEECGGASYLAQITEFPVSVNIEDNCKKLNQYFQLRNIIHISNEAIGTAFELGSDPIELIDAIQKNINSVVISDSDGGKLVRDILPEVCDIIDKRIDNKQKLTGVDTGFTGLNWYTCGFQATDYIVLAARPSMGKTSLALNFLKNASDSGVCVDFYSLEMSKEQLLIRLISMVGEIPYRNLRSGYLTKEELGRYMPAASTVYETKALIDDNGDSSIGEIRRKARKNHKKHATGLIIIDYLQLIKKEKQSTNDAVSDISRECKMMAKELNVPVIVLSQLNRKLEERGNKIPILSDLRDSGAVEQDADIVLFPFRPAVYIDPKFEDDGKTEKPQYTENKNKAFLYISKHRNGPIGCTSLFWDERYSTFKNLGDDYNGY